MATIHEIEWAYTVDSGDAKLSSADINGQKLHGILTKLQSLEIAPSVVAVASDEFKVVITRQADIDKMAHHGSLQDWANDVLAKAYAGRNSADLAPEEFTSDAIRAGVDGSILKADDTIGEAVRVLKWSDKVTSTDRGMGGSRVFIINDPNVLQRIKNGPNSANR